MRNKLNLLRSRNKPNLRNRKSKACKAGAGETGEAATAS
jgi:hypothetical protein